MFCISCLIYTINIRSFSQYKNAIKDMHSTMLVDNYYIRFD